MVQTTPIFKVPEVRKLMKDYCSECRQSAKGWTVFSDLLAIYPYFDISIFFELSKIWIASVVRGTEGSEQ